MGVMVPCSVTKSCIVFGEMACDIPVSAFVLSAVSAEQRVCSLSTVPSDGLCDAMLHLQTQCLQPSKKSHMHICGSSAAVPAPAVHALHIVIAANAGLGYDIL